jgi:hypothetical protein
VTITELVTFLKASFRKGDKLSIKTEDLLTATRKLNSAEETVYLGEIHRIPYGAETHLSSMPLPNPLPDTPEILALTEVFREAGATNPELWARSQVQEGKNQLARFSFLKAISTDWLPETATDWVEAQLHSTPTTASYPGAQLPAVVQEMVTKGVRLESIVDLVRVIQFEALFHVCQTLDVGNEADNPIADWALFEVDEQGQPTRVIDALQESLLAFDPSGREMRPRSK